MGSEIARAVSPARLHTMHRPEAKSQYTAFFSWLRCIKINATREALIVAMVRPRIQSHLSKPCAPTSNAGTVAMSTVRMVPPNKMAPINK